MATETHTTTSARSTISTFDQLEYKPVRIWTKHVIPLQIKFDSTLRLADMPPICVPTLDN